MSTPAQVTEAHRAITESVCELLDSEEMIGPSPVERAAQLIADSEARAVVEIAMVAAESADRNVSLRLERDQLRAEVERLTAEVANQKVQNNHNWQFQEISEEALKRAERAEAEVADLKANNRFHRGHSAGYAEAKADCEAELAAERARLDYMSNCVFEHLHNETGDHLGYEWTISSDGGSCDVTLRDVIDAEMKEEAK